MKNVKTIHLANKLTNKLAKKPQRLNFATIALLASLALSSTACSVKGSIEDLSELFGEKSGKTSAGLVAGSKQNVKLNGYYVSASLGDPMTGIRQTSGGYNVYSSVQGSLAIDPQ